MRWPFEQWGASAVLSGHDHIYERLGVGQIPYFVNGLGGKSLYSYGTILPQSIVRYNSDYGAMLVTCDYKEMTFKFINRQNVVIDTYRIKAKLIGTQPHP